MRSVVLFAAGFACGMLFLVVLMWRSGSLQPVRADPAKAPGLVPAPGSRELKTAPPAQRETELPRKLIIPVKGASARDILDTFNELRGGGARRHEAVDIMAPRGTPVIAVDQGPVVKLFHSQRGGLTVYQFDDTRTWCYYYAHLDSYAPGLREGMLLRQADPVGYVGSTGDAEAAVPHLHFAIFRLGPEKRWWEGTPINPYPLLVHPGR